MMSRLNVKDHAGLSAETRLALEPFKIKDKISDVYLQIGNSEPALQAYLAMEQALKQSSLSVREIESVKLLASEINRCDYCLAVHHYKASVAGFSDAEIKSIRRAQPIGDTRVDAIVQIVNAFFAKPGVVSDTDLSVLKEAGFSDSELVDIAMATSTIFFTNIFNHVNHTSPGLPVPPPLD